MNDSKRRVLGALATGVFVLVLALGLAACGSDDSDSSGGEGGDTTALSIGMNSPTYSTQMATFVAIDEGFFEEEGIGPVEVVTADNYVAGLVGGSLQITQGDTDTLLAAAQKDPDVKLIGNYRSKEFHMLALGPDIDDVSELEGKNVTGGERGSRNEAVVKEMLTELGVDPNSVNFVPFGGGSDDRMAALLAGQIDATNLFPRHTVPLEEGGGKFVFDEVVDLPQESVATTQGYLDSNEETVVAYWRAILKAREFIEDEANWDRVFEICKDNKLEVTPEFEKVFDKEVIQVSPDGGFDVAAMDQLISQEQDLELLPADLEWREYFDFQPLWTAQEELDLEQNPASADVE